MAVGNYSVDDFIGAYGSFSVWSVDFTKDPPVGKQIASVPDTDNLNGLAIVPALPETVFLADAGRFAVRSLNTTSGKSRIEIMSPIFANTSTFSLGINGIEYFGHYLYFTNSALGVFGRIPLRLDYSILGTIEEVTTLKETEGKYDDFAIDKYGNGVLPIKPAAVDIVNPSSGEQTTIINGTTSDMSGPTSVVFGRGSRKEEGTLYLTTSGMFDLGPGGGQVVAIDNYYGDAQTTDITKPEPYSSSYGIGRAMSQLWKQRVLQ